MVVEGPAVAQATVACVTIGHVGSGTVPLPLVAYCHMAHVSDYRCDAQAGCMVELFQTV